MGAECGKRQWRKPMTRIPGRIPGRKYLLGLNHGLALQMMFA